MDTFIRVKKNIGKYIEAGDRVLAAVSGGPDSMALLDVLARAAKEMNISLYAAHLNHNLRGRESEKDLLFVKKQSALRGIRLIAGSASVRKLAAENNSGIEKAGRDARYAFFIKAAIKNRINKIALGHNLDDNAETILFRFIKGAGGPGLSGIPAKRNVAPGEFGVKWKGKRTIILIRPLICERKKDIIAYLEKNRIPYRTDRSNNSGVYARNRVRNNLIPMIEKEHNNSFKEAAARTALILTEEGFLLDSMAAEWMKRNVKKQGRAAVIKRSAFSAQPEPLKRRITALILKGALKSARKITFNLIEGAMAAIGAGSAMTLPEGAFILPGKKRGEAVLKRPGKSARGK